MERADKDLAFLLRYENVAWFENGEVRILDRRVYPAKVEFVTCRTHGEVAQAITDMVTQSAGPYTAVPMGMALAAWECRDKTASEQMEYLKAAAYTISHARPTTQKRMGLLCDICLKEAERALSAGENVAEAIKNKTIELNNVRYERMAKIGSYLVDMFPDNGTVMTTALLRPSLARCCASAETAARTSAFSALKRARIFRARASRHLSATTWALM